MKTLFGLSFFMMVFFTSLSAIAQDSASRDFSGVTLNGLKVDFATSYSDSEIKAVFGEPDAMPWSDFGNCFTYYQKTSVAKSSGSDGIEQEPETRFEIITEYDRRVISAFFIYTDEYVINDHVTVGDSIEKAKEMGGEWRSYKEGEIVWRPESWIYTEWMCCPVFYYDEDGIITEIDFWSFR